VCCARLGLEKVPVNFLTVSSVVNVDNSDYTSHTIGRSSVKLQLTFLGLLKLVQACTSSGKLISPESTISAKVTYFLAKS
jgi:hypothetical protein